MKTSSKLAMSSKKSTNIALISRTKCLKTNIETTGDNNTTKNTTNVTMKTHATVTKVQGLVRNSNATGRSAGIICCRPVYERLIQLCILSFFWAFWDRIVQGAVQNRKSQRHWSQGGVGQVNASQSTAYRLKDVTKEEQAFENCWRIID